MFKKNKTDKTRSAGSGLINKTTPSVISSNMNILGNIISSGFVDIDGTVEGNVKCNSTTIRVNGKIQGDVVADVVQIYGQVEGLVKAKEVHLYKTARVTGIIMHESLSIEDGAEVDGKFKRTDNVFIDDDLGFPDGRDALDMLEESMDSEPEDVLENLRLVNANSTI